MLVVAFSQDLPFVHENNIVTLLREMQVMGVEQNCFVLQEPTDGLVEDDMFPKFQDRLFLGKKSPCGSAQGR